MVSLTAELSRAVGEVFAAEGLDASFGRVAISDRPDLLRQIAGEKGLALPLGTPVTP